MSIPGQVFKPYFADDVTVVLLRPQQSLNIGSVARAMMNLGFSKLALINPENFNPEKAAVTARWATSIVEGAKIYQSLESALESFQEVIGFGGRYDQKKFENVSLPDWLDRFSLVQGRRTALLFGPEDRGLSTGECNHCRFLVRIPSVAEYPSYNLAQAVLLSLYSLASMAWGDNELRQEDREMPERNDYYQLERILDGILTETGFYRQGTPEPVPGIIKRLFLRMNPDKREIRVLLAMVSRIERRLKRQSKT